MEVVVLDIHVLPGSNSYLLTLGDLSSGNTVDHYLHRKFFDMVQDEEGTIKRGRDLRMTGCRLRVGAGSCAPRLLPTEHLGEDQEHDAMLLGAQFLSDTFPSIQRGAAGDYHIYANDGSMLALERPFVNCDTMEISLESGTCTRIDCVPPCLQLEQEVTVASDHETCLGSEVLIPRNPHGAVDLNHFPARVSSGKGLETEDVQPCSLWSFGEVYSGQLVFISGLATYTDTGGRLKCSWTESTEGASFVNVSHLTAVISSLCLHSIVPVSRWSGYGQVCRVRLERVELHLHKYMVLVVGV
ncbi:hypothetical protein SELMODRAFT_420948 [Selaginella moellendorffii]|uniref:Uncharacterized protein n=1 Tax=Selaginella moellendorffii TaxID=88036 RepID=D8SDM9_SELML|nr:hypothetical protein SELMODRAFT_420948 [Selaginella moellendorffii]